MRIPSTQRSVPGDWSKGFVEHLRTVHFALLSISVALILLLLSKPYDARTAVSELNQIVSLKKFLLGPTEGWGWQTVETVPIASGEAIFYAPSFGATVGKSSTKGGIPFEGKTLTFRVSQPNVYTCARRSISDDYRQPDSSAMQRMS